MKPGQSAFQADEALYQEASCTSFNVCCTWLEANGHGQAALELAEYLNAGVETKEVQLTTDMAPAPDTQRHAARVLGYEGEACPECQNFTLVRNGTCLKCNTCGATTGCS